MKVQELFEARKKRKKKNRHSAWNGVPFAVVQSGTGDDTVGYGAGITGGSLSEEEQTEWLLPKGYVMTYVKTLKRDNRIYHITRLMDEQIIAVAGSMASNRDAESKWYFYTPNPDPVQTDMLVRNENVRNMLKMKWWVANQLVKVGLLEVEDLSYAR